MRTTVGVMGPSSATNEQLRDAYEIGKIIGELGFVLISGGLGGIMEESCRGAKETGGFVIGISPGGSKRDFNEHVDFGLPTDMGGARNCLNILSCDVVVAIGSDESRGTLNEISYALIEEKPLVIIRPPDVIRTFLTDFKGAEGHFDFMDSPEDLRDFLQDFV